MKSAGVSIVDMKYVYVMKAGARYKVGVSKDPKARANQLKTGNPDTELLYQSVALENAFKVEKKIHKDLAEYSDGREWFSRIDENEILGIVKSVISEIGIEQIIEESNNVEEGKKDVQAEEKTSVEETSLCEKPVEYKQERAVPARILKEILVGLSFLSQNELHYIAGYVSGAASKILELEGLAQDGDGYKCFTEMCGNVPANSTMVKMSHVTDVFEDLISISDDKRWAYVMVIKAYSRGINAMVTDKRR